MSSTCFFLSGFVKLESRIPAGFLDGIAALIPSVTGLNIQALKGFLGAKEGARDPTKPVFQAVNDGDKFEIFLELI